MRRRPLQKEHGQIRAELAVLETMASRLDGSGPVSARSAPALVDFFVRFAQASHIGKEERIFFPAPPPQAAEDGGGGFRLRLARAPALSAPDALSDFVSHPASFDEATPSRNDVYARGDMQGRLMVKKG